MGVRTSFLSFDISVYLFFLIFIFICVFYVCYSSKATLATVIAAAVLMQCRFLVLLSVGSILHVNCAANSSSWTLFALESWGFPAVCCGHFHDFSRIVAITIW